MIVYTLDTWKDKVWIFFRWKGSVYRRIIIVTLLYSSWGFFIAYLATWPNVGPSISTGLGISHQMHTLSAPMLGFLLVFRSQLAYNRYWSCRSALGALATGCREIVIIANNCLNEKNAPQSDCSLHQCNVIRLVGAFFFWSAAFFNRRSKITDHSFLQKWLTDQEIEVAKKSQAPSAPLLALQWVRKEIQSCYQQGMLDWVYVQHIETILLGLHTNYSSLDRIMKTPVPLPYTQALEIVLALYFLTLPLVFLPVNGDIELKLEVVVTGCMAIFTFTFYGIKNIALELEEPMGNDDNDLPLDSMCASLEQDIRMFWSDHQLARASPTNSIHTISPVEMVHRKMVVLPIWIPELSFPPSSDLRKSSISSSSVEVPSWLPWQNGHPPPSHPPPPPEYPQDVIRTAELVPVDLLGDVIPSIANMGKISAATAHMEMPKSDSSHVFHSQTYEGLWPEFPAVAHAPTATQMSQSGHQERDRDSDFTGRVVRNKDIRGHVAKDDDLMTHMARDDAFTGHVAAPSPKSTRYSRVRRASVVSHHGDDQSGESKHRDGHNVLETGKSPPRRTGSGSDWPPSQEQGQVQGQGPDPVGWSLDVPGSGGTRLDDRYTTRRSHRAAGRSESESEPPGAGEEASGVQHHHHHNRSPNHRQWVAEAKQAERSSSPPANGRRTSVSLRTLSKRSLFAQNGQDRRSSVPSLATKYFAQDVSDPSLRHS